MQKTSLMGRVRRARPGQSRRRLVKPTAPVQPRAIERWYTNQLLAMIAVLKNKVTGELVPRLAHYRSQAHMHFAGVRKDDFLEDVYGETANIRVFFAQTYTDEILKNLISNAAGQTSALNKSNLTSQIKRVLGVDLFLSDDKLEGITTSFITNNVQLIKSVESRYFNDLNQTLYDGFADGLRWEEIADNIEERFGVAETNAERIARDQINKLNGQLTEERQTEVGVTQYVWRTALDDRVRPEHEAHEGQSYEWEDPPAGTGHPGEDILCFVPGTEIQFLSPAITAFRRKYLGQVVSIGTESKRVITGTPNHPVLTLAGWKFLKDVEIGNELLEGVQIYSGNGPGAKVEDFVTTAEEMFDLLSVIGTQERISGVNEQFHGDGSTQDVDIVRTSNRLGVAINAPLFDNILKFFLELSDITATDLFGSSNFEKHTITALSTGAGEMGGSDLERALPLIHTRPLNFFRFRLAPDFNTRFEQAAPDGGPVYSETLRDGILALAALISRDNLFGVELYLIPGNLAFLKSVRVVGHNSEVYEGDVYNFETETGVYLANSQLVSNCRCWAEPILDDLI